MVLSSPPLLWCMYARLLFAQVYREVYNYTCECARIRCRPVCAITYRGGRERAGCWLKRDVRMEGSKMVEALFVVGTREV